jgi:hypothetical protein
MSATQARRELHVITIGYFGTASGPQRTEIVTTNVIIVIMVIRNRDDAVITIFEM